MEHIAIGRRDIDVAGNDDVRVVEEPALGPSGKRVEERQFVAVVPVVDGSTVGDIDGRDTQWRRDADDATRYPWLTIEELVVKIARRLDILDRVSRGDGYAVVRAGSSVRGPVAVPLEHAQHAIR